MRSYLALCILIAITAITSEAINFEKLLKTNQNQQKVNSRVLEESSFLTEVDHYRPQDERVIRFPYVKNTEFYQPGGPIFIFINEGITYTTQWLETGLMYDIAQEVNALLVTFDHRYFGRSIPTASASFEDLQYLTIEQALGDIAFLAQYIREELFAFNARVFVWGSGFGGTLAAFARQKYPHLIQGAWSSSGIFSGGAYSNENYVHLSETIRRIGGDQCADYIQLAFQTMELLMFGNENAVLQNTLNLCAEVNPNDPNDVAMFFESQIRTIINYLYAEHYNGLISLCDSMTINALFTFSEWQRTVYDFSECFDMSFDSVTDTLSNTQWNTEATELGGRQWVHLRCTQLGRNEVSGYEETLFTRHIPQSYIASVCDAILGPNYEYTYLYENMQQLEIIYGGIHPNAENIIYTNGNMDPWYPHGIHEINDTNSYVYNIESYARSADLTSINPLYDSIDLADTKESIRDIIIDWAT